MKWKKKYLFNILIFFLFLIPLISSRPLSCSDNPLALWSFNEGNGTNAQDSCYGYNTTFYGGVNWTNGVYGSGLEFNGVDSYLDAGNLFNQNMVEFSFSLWANVSDIIAYRTLFQSGNYYTNEFIEAININEGNNNYVLFMGSSSLSIKNITDNEYHHIVGTFNGSDNGNSTLYIDGVFIASFLNSIPQIDATTNYLYFAVNYINGFVLDGYLDEIAFFNRTLTPLEVYDYYYDNCNSNLQQQLIVLSYPYVNFNTSYAIKYIAYNNISSFNIGDINMDLIEIEGNISNFNFIWNSSSNDYDMNLIFTQNGDYPFTIHSSCSYLDNITGIFMVREPFYVTFRFFDDKDSTIFNSNKYINDFAYVTLEYSGTKTLFNNNYDTYLEPFISPISDQRFNKPVFHGKYLNGNTTIKLFEKDNYAIRLVDGEMTFSGIYAVPNITKSYGVNIYIGKFNLNETTSYDIYLSEKDINPYKWLFNWIYIIVVGGVFIISIFLFFMIPNYPSLSLIFGLGSIVSLTLIRLIAWFYIG